MIRHTVVFSLRHAAGSPAESDFLRDAQVLADIPGVQHFEQLAQVSAKSHFDFGFSMEFKGAAEYATYDVHPKHTAFVRDRWEPEVEIFQELDFELLVHGAALQAAG